MTSDLARVERKMRTVLEQRLESGEWVPRAGSFGYRRSDCACAVGGCRTNDEHYVFGYYHFAVAFRTSVGEAIALGSGFDRNVSCIYRETHPEWYELGLRLRYDYLDCN